MTTMPEAEGHVVPTCSTSCCEDGERNFPGKLHYMLCNYDHDLGSIVSWQPHGRCFLIHDQKRFVEEIIPLWFRQTKLASFQRQLNLYGFERLTVGPDKGAYYHNFFLRGKRLLCQKLKRIKVKNTGGRKPSSPNTEPDFYNMPYLHYETEESPEPRLREPTEVPLPQLAVSMEAAAHPEGLVGSCPHHDGGLDRSNVLGSPAASLTNTCALLPPQSHDIMFSRNNTEASVTLFSLALHDALHQQQQRASAATCSEDMILQVSLNMSPPSFPANAQWQANIASLPQTLSANHHHPRAPIDPARAYLRDQLERLEASNKSRLAAFVQYFGGS